MQRTPSPVRRIVARLAVALALVVLPVAAGAQVLDEVEVSTEGETAVVDIRLLAQVAFQRQVVTPSGNVVQLWFTITAADESANSVVEESRSVPAGAVLPAFTVRFVADRRTGTQRRIDVEFVDPVAVMRAGLGRDNRAVRVALQARPAARTPPAGATAPPADVSDPVAAVAAARAAIESGRYEDAVSALNRVLNLPPNPATQDAQELIGNGREALRENGRARAEYELYLKLYPDGPGAERVKGRLAGLSDAPSGGSGREGRVREPQWLRWGSISQSYYGGQSRIRNETTIVTPATDSTVIDVQTLSGTDQSAIVSNLDATARYRSQEWDNRFVFRDVATYSFLTGTPSENRLSALYGDFRSQNLGLGARVGRQSSMGNGVLGRYDGVNAGWTFAPHWKATVLAGTPAEPGLGGRPTFVGMAIENDHLAEGLSGDVFAITQRTEGFEDRSAVGLELRYFRPTLSAFSIVDYDLGFGTLNIGSLQTTWTPQGGATINLLYDYRRSPTLQLTNALLGEPVDSLSRLRETLTREQIERQALGLSPVSRVLLLGASYPVSTRWQLGLEGRQSSIGGTTATATLPATAGTGDVYTVTAQAIGTGLWSPSSVVVLSTSRLTSRDYDAWLFSTNTRFNLAERWTLEPGIRWYSQDNANGSTLRRIAPNLRTTWRLRETASLESEVTLERSRSRNGLVSEDSNLLFYYFGYRIDL